MKFNEIIEEVKMFDKYFEKMIYLKEMLKWSKYSLLFIKFYKLKLKVVKNKINKKTIDE